MTTPPSALVALSSPLRVTKVRVLFTLSVQKRNKKWENKLWFLFVGLFQLSFLDLEWKKPSLDSNLKAKKTTYWTCYHTARLQIPAP